MARHDRETRTPHPPHLGTVLWVAAEAVPWASTGGLGEVVGSLPGFLRSRGIDVRLCIPLHGRAHEARPGAAIAEVGLGPGAALVARVRPALAPMAGVPTYLVECDPLFARGGIYGDGQGPFTDNPFRFGALTRAALALAARLDPPPAIVHAHDWHAGLLPALLALPAILPPALRATRSVFTIHNLQHQGVSDGGVLAALGVPFLWHSEWAEHFGAANFMKAGILAADRVTTVSPSYADEVRAPAGGMGLDGPLRWRGHEFTGILNGIDTTAFNPARDPAIAAALSADNPAPRAACKAALARELGLAIDATIPLIGFVGRLVDQKGVDLLADALPAVIARGAQAVLLGSGDASLEARLRALEHAHPGAIAAWIGYDRAVARRIFAGADIMVVPSRAEPCGLVQLYALRYGAIPLVHAVGGLRDTVRDGVNGFVFEEPSAAAIGAGLERAIAAYRDPPRWRQLIAQAMREDWSWERSAARYAALYAEALATPKRLRAAPPGMAGITLALG